MTSNANPIIIVEDSPEDYYAARRGLTAAGLANRFIHCETGEAALDYLYRREGHATDETWKPPQLVLLDLNLPGIDGNEVLAIIKNDETLKSIPVVVLTTSDDERDIERSYALGANSYIRKPVDLNGFIVALQRLKDYWFEVVVLPGKR